ncbi:MAG: hypothetical protein JJ975_02740 [Bacteroidia bacterium]|nr:hypothetical protein [Bacteroidia bacterium]
MELPQEYIRYPNPASEQALARRFGLHWHKNDQDWELIVADGALVPQLMRAYGEPGMDEDTKFVLMMLLVACFDELANEEDISTNVDWLKCQTILRKEFWLHITTIHYWSALDSEEAWSVSPGLRGIWDEVKHHFY